MTVVKLSLEYSHPDTTDTAVTGLLKLHLSDCYMCRIILFSRHILVTGIYTISSTSVSFIYVTFISNNTFPEEHCISTGYILSTLFCLFLVSVLFSLRGNDINLEIMFELVKLCNTLAIKYIGVNIDSLGFPT